MDRIVEPNANHGVRIVDSILYPDYPNPRSSLPQALKPRYQPRCVPRSLLRPKLRRRSSESAKEGPAYSCYHAELLRRPSLPEPVPWVLKFLATIEREPTWRPMSDIEDNIRRLNGSLRLSDEPNQRHRWEGKESPGAKWLCNRGMSSLDPSPVEVPSGSRQPAPSKNVQMPYPVSEQRYEHIYRKWVRLIPATIAILAGTFVCQYCLVPSSILRFPHPVIMPSACGGHPSRVCMPCLRLHVYTQLDFDAKFEWRAKVSCLVCNADWTEDRWWLTKLISNMNFAAYGRLIRAREREKAALKYSKGSGTGEPA